MHEAAIYLQQVPPEHLATFGFIGLSCLLPIASKCPLLLKEKQKNVNNNDLI